MPVLRVVMGMLLGSHIPSLLSATPTGAESVPERESCRQENP
jgi:hypothetical protein